MNADELAVEVAQRLEDVGLTNDLFFVIDGSLTDPRSAQLRVIRAGRTVAYRAFEPGPAQCRNFLGAVGFSIALAIKAAQPEQSSYAMRVAQSTRASAWAIAAAGLVSHGLLSEVAPGAEVFVRYSLSNTFALRAGVSAVATWNATLAPAAGSFNAALTTLRTDVCARAAFVGPLGGGLCFGAMGGVLYAAGVNVPRSESSVVPWFALAGTANLELNLSARWTLIFQILPTMLLHSVRVGLVDDGGGMVASRHLSRFSVIAGLGLMIRL